MIQTSERGAPRTEAFNALTPLVGAPGALIISQDGFLDAQGTASAPIIMTTGALDVNTDGIADDNAGGGNGCISVTANVAPALCAEMQAACAAGDEVVVVD